MEKDLHIDQHISRRFNDELETLRNQVLAMGGLVERQCRQALDALIKHQADVAQVVAGSDYQVNELEVEISALCTDLLARRQPAASDLRMVVAVIRIVANLERIGDEAAQIGRYAMKLADDNDSRVIQGEPLHLGESVVAMLGGALDAFARLDVQAAIAVAACDPDIEKEFKSLTRLLISHMMEEPQRVKNMLRVNWCARALERIGSHAVNICEEVVYLVEGSDVRHVSLEEIQQRFIK